MGLTCSLLGHEYGETVEERDRDETDSEVVVTVRELQTCERCGAEQVVSENTEVRSLTPATATGETESTATDGDAPDDVTGDGTAGADGSASGSGVSGPTTDAHDETFDPPSPEEDDAVILEDEPEEPAARERGQWPEAADTRLDEQEAPADTEDADASEPASDDANATGVDDADTDGPRNEDAGESESTLDDEAAGDTPGDASTETATADEDADDESDDLIDADAESAGDEHAVGAHAVGDWPDPTVGDEGYSAEPSSGGPDVEFGGGLTPQSTENVSGEGPELAAGDATGIQSAPAREQSDEVNVDAEFVCPNCEFVTDALGGSLRQGDICPECQRGYLAEQ